MYSINSAFRSNRQSAISLDAREPRKADHANWLLHIGSYVSCYRLPEILLAESFPRVVSNAALLPILVFYLPAKSKTDSLAGIPML